MESRAGFSNFDASYLENSAKTLGGPQMLITQDIMDEVKMYGDY